MKSGFQTKAALGTTGLYSRERPSVFYMREIDDWQQENYNSPGCAANSSVHSVRRCNSCAPLPHHYYLHILILRRKELKASLVQKFLPNFRDVQPSWTRSPRLPCRHGSHVPTSGPSALRAQDRADTAAAKAQKASTVSVSGPFNSPPKAGSRPKPKRVASQLQGGGDGVGPPPKASRIRTIRAPERYSE
jgi:hypothetical protein